MKTPVKAPVRLPERQRFVLQALATHDSWARPMDVGAFDGSHHTATLRALMKKGLVERKLRGSLLNQIRGSACYEAWGKIKKRGRSAPRGSYEYRVTAAGLQILKSRTP
jgi:hypothetical protein